MVTCPDCGLSITFHNLKYTHKRYCKALNEKQEESASASVVATPIQQAPPPPGLLMREKKTDVEDVNEYMKNNPEVIINYLRNERANKANERQFNAKSLL
eukprot:16082301-Heterocapsa_arctica.AAC.1